ncbi:hypothetical protein BYT27DRAFT_7135471 [Phlegmacium glaucopus]|nr:hypothetical protein BYT27DRAFT_7135471 [Phlegmacium glaucopus]
MSVSSGSSTQRVLVSYSVPPIFLASPNWNKVYAALVAQLPLKNIHRKSPPKQSVKTIQELDVTLVALDTVSEEPTSQVPSTLLEKPLLHIFIFHCEDNDLEAYRTVHKKQIKDWHTGISARKNPEWLILQIIKPDATRSAPGNFFQIKGTVLDKLKTDFNSDKRDRCAQVNWVTGNENPLAWAEFINKMKDGLLCTFDSAITQRQEEVKRSENQQSMPGWNFCTFFILKESLATSFEGMNLFEEALVPYDELEASFYRVSKEKNMSWFGSLVHSDPQDESLPLLSTAKKPYRDLILANRISIFDFRIYLLARQCQLLAKMGRMTELTSKVALFLVAFGSRLREAESTLPPLFVEAWIYSSALSAVEQCTTWSTDFKLEASKSGSAGKGELLDVARTQLDIIGIEAGYLPPTPPFSTALSMDKQLQPGTKIQFINETLNTAVSNQQAFYELYAAITNRAIDFYAKSGRRKFALKLHGTLSALEVHRGNFSAALNTYTSLPAHYAPHLWTSLESFMLSRALDTHGLLEKAQDVEWIHIVLSFLKTYVEQCNSEMLLHEADRISYIANLINSLKISAKRLETDLAHPDHPALLVQISPDARLAETRDGTYLDVTISNHLPCVFPADDIIVTVAGRDSTKFTYSSPIPDGCPPGKLKLTLFCPTYSSGLFALESSEIRSSHLLLQSNYRKGSNKSQASKPSLLRVPRDLLALDVQISQSDRIELGRSPSLMVVISTGRNHIERLTVRLSSSVTFRCQDVVLLEDEHDYLFECDKDKITLGNIQDDQTVTFLVPHSDASAFAAMKVNLEVEYQATNEPSIRRISQFSRVLVTTLPISVNVEDFFRGNRLISKFTVSTTSHQHVRIADASLDLPSEGLDGVKIRPGSSNRPVVTVTPAQPANFLFALESAYGPVRESLILTIKYRMLREEVESIIESHVQAVLEDSPSLQHHTILVGKLVDALESDAAWVELYGITGELIVPDIHEEEGEIGELLKKARQLLAKHSHPEPPAGSWREIKIPVDVPIMNIVAAACIHIVSTPFAKEMEPNTKPSLYAGQPISANLTIKTSFHWGAKQNDPTRRYALRFNVEDMVREWLVSGPKRGDFMATHGTIHTVPITMIALHHGEFPLPKVSITALPTAGLTSMSSMAVPSIETYQEHGAEKVLILPRGGRSTFVVGMGSG